MQKKHDSVIKNLSTYEMLRKACADDAELAAAIRESLDQPKKLIEETFQRLEIGAKKSTIFDAATDDESRAF